jgi:hypothetical protein
MTTVKSTTTLALAGFIVSLSTACQKYEGNKILPPDAKTTVQSLTGKTPAAVLNTKYKSAVLTCSLWIEHTNKPSANSEPLDTFSLDLMRATSGPGIVNLKGEIDDLAVGIKLRFDDIGIFDTTLFGDDGVTYSVKRSPYFRYDFEILQSQKSTGSNLGGVYRSSRGVTERFADVALDLTRTFEGDEIPYLEKASCMITTDLKPEFADHFKPIQVN